jgi:formylglycine-generating enzyme required for sulfatase activity
MVKQKQRAAMRHVILAGPREQELASADDEHPGAEVTRRARSHGAHAARKRVKILFFAANIRTGEQLALDEEYRAIEQAIRTARHRDAFQLIPKLAARRSDLQDALLEHSPDVVHFACHGSSQAEILLLSDGPGSEPVPAAALASLFGVLRDNLALVVFNACFASEQASAIRQCAGLAIGMRARIEDRAAIAFASALYGALAYGRSVRDAFDLGVAAVEAVDARQKRLPRLFAGTGLDARTVHLVSDARHRRLFGLFGGAAAGALLVLVWLLLRFEPSTSQSPAKPSTSPPPPSGMARFSAASIRPGVFAAGSRPQECSALTTSEDCAELEHPERVGATHVEAFDLDRFEVANGEFAAWLNRNVDLWKLTPYGIVTTRNEPAIPLLRTEKCGDGLTITPENRAHVTAEAARWPVGCVAWDGADAYCRAQGKRLPLETEWELAAKGPEGRPFPWGTDLPRQDGVAFELRYGAAVHPRVGGDSPQDVSPEGVHDLGGNVAEWVEDRRGSPNQKTLRGGGFGTIGPCHLLGSGCRHIPPNKYQKDIGFRCARSVIDRQREER